MAKAGEIYLGASAPLTLLQAGGRKLRIKPIEILREGRVSSGAIKQEITAVKHTIILDYSYIKSADLAVIDGLYALNTELTLQIYHTDTVYDEYTVVMRPSERERVLLNTLNGGLWSGVSVELEEV